MGTSSSSFIKYRTARTIIELPLHNTAVADWLDSTLQHCQSGGQAESPQVQAVADAWQQTPEGKLNTNELPGKWLQWLATQGPTGQWLQGQWVQSLQVSWCNGMEGT